MELLPVESSHIESIGYDGDTLTLAIRYKTGKLYVHPGVTATQFGALMTAPSKGAWVARFRAGPLKAKHRTALSAWPHADNYRDRELPL